MRRVIVDMDIVNKMLEGGLRWSNFIGQDLSDCGAGLCWGDLCPFETLLA